MHSLKKTHYLLTLALAAFPLWLPWPVSYLSGLWALISFIIIGINRRAFKKDQLKWWIISILPFLCILAAYPIYDDKGTIHLLERSHLLWIIPTALIFFPYQFSGTQLTWIKRSFILGILFTFIFFLVFWYAGGDRSDYQADHDFFFRLRTEFNTITKIHPGYAALYCSLGILFLLEEYRKKTLPSYLSIGGLIILTLSIVVLMARLPAFATLAAVLLWTLVVGPKKNRLKRIWIYLGVVAFLAGGMVLVKGSRWQEWSDLYSTHKFPATENSLSARAGIFECSKEIAEEHWLTGIGPVQLQLQLDQCYLKKNVPALQRGNFNTHNQYMDYLLAYGIVGLIALVLTLAIPMISFSRKNIVYFLFLLIIAIAMIGENILSRMAGIVFFSFFNGLFILQSRSRNPEQNI